jgi:hypothetical protein
MWVGQQGSRVGILYGLFPVTAVTLGIDLFIYIVSALVLLISETQVLKYRLNNEERAAAVTTTPGSVCAGPPSERLLGGTINRIEGPDHSSRAVPLAFTEGGQRGGTGLHSLLSLPLRSEGGGGYFFQYFSSIC